MDIIDFCRKFKKSPGKHSSWSILKEVKHPTTFDWCEFRHCYSSCRLRKFSSVKTHFFIDRGDTYLNKIIEKCWLRFKNDRLIYCSIENVVQRELLPGHFWTFLHTSNYARKQVLIGGSSDWLYSEYGCECKLLQTLVKSLKICLKEFFFSIFIYSVFTVIIWPRFKRLTFTFYSKTFFLKSSYYIPLIFFCNNHVTIRIQKTRIIANV